MLCNSQQTIQIHFIKLTKSYGRIQFYVSFIQLIGLLISPCEHLHRVYLSVVYLKLCHENFLSKIFINVVNLINLIMCIGLAL